jgi:hypothetical protein
VIFLVFWREQLADRIRRIAVFQFCVAMATLFMATQLSEPIWRIVTPLHSLPYPTRFLNVFIVMVPGLSAIAFPFLWQHRKRMLATFAGLFVLSWLAADIWAGSMAFWVWRPIPKDKAEYYRDLAAFHKSVASYHFDYFAFARPRWTREHEMNDLPAFAGFAADYPPRAIKSLGIASGQPVGVSTVESWRPRQIALKLDELEPARLTVNHFYYPGWRGRIESAGTVIPITPSKPDGFLQMDVPKGSYRLILELGREWPERLGIQISLFSLIITAGLVVRSACWRTPAP